MKNLSTHITESFVNEAKSVKAKYQIELKDSIDVVNADTGEVETLNKGEIYNFTVFNDNKIEVSDVSSRNRINIGKHSKIPSWITEPKNRINESVVNEAELKHTFRSKFEYTYGDISLHYDEDTKQLNVKVYGKEFAVFKVKLKEANEYLNDILSIKLGMSYDKALQIAQDKWTKSQIDEV